MNIILHIGYNKTGTSSIQAFLDSKREELLQRDILYPSTGIFDCAHYGISGLLIGKPLSKLVRADKQLVDDLRAEIVDAGSSCVVISSEYFIVANPIQIATIKDFLIETLGAKSVKIVLYVRRHDLWIESLFNQEVKTQDNPAWELDIRDYFLHILGGQNPSLSYLETIDQWAKVFGSEAIVVRPFEREQFKDGDLISDFLTIFDKPLDISINSTLQNEALEGGILYLIGLIRKMPAGGLRNKLIARCFRMNTVKIPFAPKNFGKFSAATRKSVVKFFGREYSVIARKYLSRSDGKLFFKEP